MLVINYSKAFIALEKAIETHNQKQSERKHLIRQSVAATAKELIRLYGRDLVKAAQQELFCVEELPSFRTNNQHLSKVARASPRTIQRHLIRLQDAEIISAKVWHGSKADFELWINPKILCIKVRESTKQVKSPLNQQISKSLIQASKRHFLSAKATKRPHIDCGNTNNIIIDVDSAENDQRCELSLTVLNKNWGHKRGGHTGKKVSDSEKTGKKGRDGGASEKSDYVAFKQDVSRAASLDLYADMLWTLAKQTLYSHHYLTDSQLENTPKLIRKWYEPVNTQNLHRVHQIYVERLRLVRKYVQKDPNQRYVRLPYQFFDPGFDQGFRVTKAWWEKEQLRKAKIKEQAIYRGQLQRISNNNDKPKHQQLDPLALFQACERNIKSLNNAQLLADFYTQCIGKHNELT